MTNYITKESLFEIQSVTNPILAPNEKEALFIRTQLNEEENNYNAHLFHIDLESGETTQWTYGNERVSSPQWSPDGKQVAFLAKRKEKQQLYILNSRGGEAQELTTFPNGVNSYLWSPCGEKLWITSTVKKGLSITEQEEKEEKKVPKAYIVDKMKYKADGVGLLPQERYSHIAKVDLATKEVSAFTEGDFSHSLQGISHDGKTLVIAVNRVENTDDVFRTPLFLVDVETKEETVLIDVDGYYGGAEFSFDDRYIAFGGSDHTYKNATHGHIYIYDRETKMTQKLTEMLDVPVGDYAVADIQQGVEAPTVIWTENNDLYFQVSTEGDIRLYYATLEGAIYPASPENEHVYGYAVFKNGNRALITVSNPTFPGELFDYDITTGERKQLTAFNAEFLEATTLSTPEAISYVAKDGITVHGWIMKPAQYTEGKKYPFIVEVHGGPHTLYANTFFHEMQLLAAQGYGVLYVNPRGSHGYSQEFVDGVRGNYGEGDYEDIMAGVDYALENYAWIDESRLGITGGSYGGFMTNWVVGHTNRFKAAVTQRSISNWISFYGVSDIGYYFSEWQMLADMNDVEKLWHHSPLKYAANVETPLLILHSERDFRCPIEQAEQLYVTLKRMGKEVGFVRFPECDHNLSRTGIPNLRLERLEQITGWFEKYL
ncbi:MULTISPECIES: alpha/beta hydrolase family protein [Solibacillus]|uniref:S9 family peptidase n=1 Tax=Solibacillus merdavium TaxID=2762218 RepID=A0ABR8XPL3_9BACL|nr:S9 family peptidase [Solibacillus merdavium]MBD8033888.1 S9 family peptidase [Solibacillus merdavium]